LDSQIKAAEGGGEEDEDGENGDDTEGPTDEEVKAWKKERTLVNKRLKTKQGNFEVRLNAAVNALNEPAAADLLLTILHNDVAAILDRYTRLQRQEVVNAFETWWDKYKVTLVDIEVERDAAARQLQEFLVRLGYVS